MIHENHKQFFERAGHHFLYPESGGECIYSVSVEEMYKHFKARLMAELHADRPGGFLVERHKEDS